MKNFFVILLIGGTLAGCSSGTNNATPKTSEPVNEAVSTDTSTNGNMMQSNDPMIDTSAVKMMTDTTEGLRRPDQ